MSQEEKTRVSHRGKAMAMLLAESDKVLQWLKQRIAEEPFFRGFLWGALRRAGWEDVWIWAFQAALFWLAHIYWLGRSPVSFWVVPLGGLVFGILAWRSRSIAVSMVAHGLVNGVMQMVLFYRL